MIKLDIEEKRREMKIMTKIKIKYGFIQIRESTTTLIKSKYLEYKQKTLNLREKLEQNPKEMKWRQREKVSG